MPTLNCFNWLIWENKSEVGARNYVNKKIIQPHLQAIELFIAEQFLPILDNKK